ncbi:hypothetical protein, partial [Microbulbifer sp. 2205BS26-8]|uniref:hypothetical protein n=1 Tax=Microbulbifer sp. 2205BS26-8 TaxID=3064386 RepID=UPI00273E4296
RCFQYRGIFAYTRQTSSPEMPHAERQTKPVAVMKTYIVALILVFIPSIGFGSFANFATHC